MIICLLCKRETWRICSRWQRHFCRPLESQLHQEHLESTESWSKAGWCGIVKDFFKKYKKDPRKVIQIILQNPYAPLRSVASNASARKVSLSKAKSWKHDDLLNNFFSSNLCQIDVSPWFSKHLIMATSQPAHEVRPELCHPAEMLPHQHITNWDEWASKCTAAPSFSF